MKLLRWLKRKPKTDKQLQAELAALVNRITADQFNPTFFYHATDLMNRYEKLLREIYARGLEPCSTLEVMAKKGTDAPQS